MSATVTLNAVEGESRTPTSPEPTVAPKPKKHPPAKPKKAAAKKPTPKTSRYPEWVADAVKSGRHLSGQKPNSGADGTVAYAGPTQHITVRKRAAAMIDGPVTPDAILALSGVKSHKLLRERSPRGRRTGPSWCRCESSVASFGRTGGRWAGTWPRSSSRGRTSCEPTPRPRRRRPRDLADMDAFEVLWLIVLFLAVIRA